MAERRGILKVHWNFIFEIVTKKTISEAKSTETDLKLYQTYIFGHRTENKEHGPDKSL
jgi:hypothetical protein